VDDRDGAQDVINLRAHFLLPQLTYYVVHGSVAVSDDSPNTSLIRGSMVIDLKDLDRAGRRGERNSPREERRVDVYRVMIEEQVL
jgi:hypothetical protein